MRVLVTTASRCGSTSEIAEAVADVLTEEGLEVATEHPDRVSGLDGYDAVVVGSAVYYGRWLDPARLFVERHAAALSERPVWLFSSGPVGAPEHLLPRTDAVDVRELLAESGAIDHCLLPGRLDRDRLRLRDRGVITAMHAHDGDYRDWEAVEAFARQIADRLRLGVPVGQHTEGGR